jgi:hypothetical protein
MPHIVIEEIWSIASAPDNRKLLRSSAEPLFHGGRQAAFDYAKKCAGEFTYHGLEEGAERPYWWGRNHGDRANHRFVIRPAPD